jgi:hypothetical protein
VDPLERESWLHEHDAEAAARGSGVVSATG